MKHFTLLFKSILLALFMGQGFASNAQLVVDMHVVDSLSHSCTVPAVLGSYLMGTTSSYSPGATVNIDVYYGDGTSDHATTNLYYAGPSDNGFGYPFNHTFNLPGLYNVLYVVTGPDGQDDSLTDPVYISDTCGNISGKAYVDQNSNCVFDAGDDVISYAVVTFNGSMGNAYAMADASGNYSIELPVGVSYTASIDHTSTYAPTCPVSGTHSVTATSSPQVFDFGYECTSDFDLMTWGHAVGFVPGLTANVWASALNYSCNSLPATLTLTLDPLVTYTGYTGIAPTSVSGSTITWDFTSIPVHAFGFSSFNVGVQVMTSTSATIGDDVCFTYVVTPTTGDINPANNTYTFCNTVASSYDPNMKEVMPRGEGVEGFVPANTSFDYTIHFQNTGTYQAFDIYIMDTLDTDLDLATFEIMGSSHDMTPYLVGNIVKFDFPDINLPDSTSNEPESHGWVKYRIKTKAGLAEGTPVENTAHIYFDYNPAIVTNTTLNTVEFNTSVNDADLTNNSVLVYPNPSGTYVNLKAEGLAGATAFVYDITGKLITQITLTGDQTTIDVSKWNNGLYEISIPASGKKPVRFQKIN